ncbi:MAG: TadA family conjugal transfer-associated ATPase [Candidatus Nanopelagicales bacterium]|nr:TadA family conjugal transfer-associated ATPase [Candidatus Nanopelagicales bacterium]
MAAQTRLRPVRPLADNAAPTPSTDPTTLAKSVREWLAERDLDPIAANVGRALRGVGLVADPGLAQSLVARITAELCGAGPLQSLLERPGVTDVLVNGSAGVWVDDGSGLHRSQVRMGDEGQIRALAQRLAALAGRRLDDSSPFVDARLPDGVRLHAALAPLAHPGTLISLRVGAAAGLTLDDLLDRRSISAAGLPWLKAMVAARLAFLVTGGTGSGKTTVLQALLEVVPMTERIVVVEESSELRPSHPHCVSLEGRVANAEAAGRVNLTDLVRQAMRMRPDRIVLGEARGAEVTDLLAAMNTGHEGCSGTVHANEVYAVPPRLEALALTAGLGRAAVHSQIAAGLDAVLHVVREPDGSRRIQTIGGVEMKPDGIAAVRRIVSFTERNPVVHAPSHPVIQRMLAAMGRTAGTSLRADLRAEVGAS